MTSVCVEPPVESAASVLDRYRADRSLTDDDKDILSLLSLDGEPP